MKLVQCRIVSDHVGALAAFYAELVGAAVTPNEYYVEVPTGAVSVGFSRPRFTEYEQAGATDAGAGQVVLDFLVDDVDAEYERIKALNVEWVLPPTTQPWGNRTMVFRDPEGILINVFSRPEQAA